MIEIGIPFSDPMADGIVIQDAATCALRNGMSLRLLFEQLQDIRRDVRIPLLLMGYLNPIMHFGFEAFCRKCAECGIDGVIIPDLPFRDYEKNYKTIALKYDLRVIMLITPETDEKRIREIDAHTDGFIIWYHQLLPPAHKRISTTENRLISKNSRHESAQPTHGRFRYQQQTDFRCCLLPCFRSYHRKPFRNSAQ